MEDLSIIQIDNNNLKDAESSLNSLINLNPDIHEILNYYQNNGKLLLKQNNFEKAEKSFQKAIEICTNNFNFNNYKLAETYFLTCLSLIHI